ncbi:MAG: hypothetical protein V1855_01145 [bacterium]
MKIKTVYSFAIFFCIFSFVHIDSKTMPKISRLRDKIDSALKTEDTHSFKDLFKQAQETSLDGHVVITVPKEGEELEANDARTMNSFELSLKIDDLKKQLKNLYWSNNVELLANLQALLTTEKRFGNSITDQYEALLLLKTSIVEKHGDKKVPLFDFINSLQEEDSVLSKHTTSIFKILSKNSAQKNQLNQLLQQTQDLKSNLSALTQVVEKVLLS